jgi:hypothetical protein
MVPSAYNAYLEAVTTAAAALIGLLFVAVSVRDDTIFGDNAVPGDEALAITAFTGLVNSFVVSLLGLIPDTNIGLVALIMGPISTYTIVRLHFRLHWARNSLALVIAVGAYLLQIAYGIALVNKPSNSGDVANLAFVLFANLIFSLQRAWALLRGRHVARGAAATAGPAPAGPTAAGPAPATADEGDAGH